MASYSFPAACIVGAVGFRQRPHVLHAAPATSRGYLPVAVDRSTPGLSSGGPLMPASTLTFHIQSLPWISRRVLGSLEGSWRDIRLLA